MYPEDPFLNALREWLEASMHRSLHAFIRHTRESDLSFSQVNTLFRLYHHGSSSVNDLARYLSITKAAVSQLLDPLITVGLVLQSENPEDRRMRLVGLTDKGQDMVENSMNIWHAWLAELLQIFSDAEKAQLHPAIQLLNQRTQELRAEWGRPCQADSRT